MPVTPTNASKNNATVTNANKTGEAVTWDEATFTWDDSYPSTWDNVRTPIVKTSKNSASVSNASKT